MAVKQLGAAPTIPAHAATKSYVDDLLPLTTRTMTLNSGGTNGGSITANTPSVSAVGFRMVLKLPCDTTRFRVKLRTYDGWTPGTGPTLTGKAIIFGEHIRGSSGDGEETFNFVGSAATTIVGSDFTIPGGDSFYTSPWVADPGDKFEAGKEHLIGISATLSSQALSTAWGQVLLWTNATSATDPAITSGGVAGSVPLDMMIEYESTTSRTAWLIVGDSITEGVQGPQGTTSGSITPQPWHRSWPQLWAARHNALVNNLSLSGMQAKHYAEADQSGTRTDLWDRVDHSDAHYNGAVIFLGSNDAANGNRSLSTYQGYIAVIVARIRTYIGPTAPIFVMTVPPRNLNSTPEGLRVSYNEWLLTAPFGIAGVIDVDSLMRQGDTAALLNDLRLPFTTDQTHPSYRGVARIAAEVGAIVGRNELVSA
jgi:lysophospholipase L1-like esterase